MATSGLRNQEDDSWWNKATASDDQGLENDRDCKFIISEATTSGGVMYRKERPYRPNLNGTFTVEGINDTHLKDDVSVALINGTIPLCNTDNARNISHLHAGKLLKDTSFLLETEYPSELLQLSIDSPLPGISTNASLWAEKLCSYNFTSMSSLTGTSSVNESPWHGAEEKLAECDADFAFQEMILLSGNNGDSKHVSKYVGDKSGNMDQVGKCPDKLNEFPLIDGLQKVASIVEKGRDKSGIGNGMGTQERKSSEVEKNGDDFIDKYSSIPQNRETLQPNHLSAKSDNTDDGDACNSDFKGIALMENKNPPGKWSEGCKVKNIECDTNVTSEINPHATALLSNNESNNVKSDRLMLIDECTTTKETLKDCTDLPNKPFETEISRTQHSRHMDKDDNEKNENEYEELARHFGDTDRSGENDIGSNCDSSNNIVDDDEQDHNPCIATVKNSICETPQVLWEKDKSCLDSIDGNVGFACDQQNHINDHSFGCTDRDDPELLPASGENKALEELLSGGNMEYKMDLAPSCGQAAKLSPEMTPTKSTKFFSGLELCTSTPLICSNATATAIAHSGPRSRFGFRAPAVSTLTSRESSVPLPAEPLGNRLNCTNPIDIIVHNTISSAINLNSTKSIGTNLNSTRSTGTNIISSRLESNVSSTKSSGRNLNAKSIATNLKITRPKTNLNSTKSTGTNINNTIFNNTTATFTNLNHTISPKEKMRHLARPPLYASKLPGPGSSSSALTKPISSSSRLARPALATTKPSRSGLCRHANASSPGPQLSGPISPTQPLGSVVNEAKVGGVGESCLLSSRAALTHSIVTITSGKYSKKSGGARSSQVQPSLHPTKPVRLAISPERTQSSKMTNPQQIQASNSARTKPSTVGPRKLATPRATFPWHPRPKPHPLGLRTPSTRLVDVKGEGVTTLGMPGVTGRRGDGGVCATPESIQSSVKTSRLVKPPSTNSTKLTRPNLNVSEKTKPNYSSVRLAEPKTPLVKLAGQYSNSLKLNKTNASISKLTKPVLNIPKFSKSTIVSKPTKPNLAQVALARSNSNTSKLERTNSSISKPPRPDTGISRFTRPGLNASKLGKPNLNISKLTGPAESTRSKTLRPNLNFAKPTRTNLNVTSIARPDTNSCKLSRPNSSIYRQQGPDSRGSRLARPNPPVSKLTVGMDTVEEVAMLRKQLSWALRACQALAIVVQYLQE